MRCLIQLLTAFLLLQMVACSTLPSATEAVADTAPAGIDNAWTQGSGKRLKGKALPWQHFNIPGKASTQYDFARIDGRDAMAVKAISSASLLRQKVLIAPNELHQITFSWKVPELMAHADMTLRDADDSPVRIVLAFDGDRSRFSARNAMLSELTHTITGEPLPYATLMYVWCNTRTPGTVITNPRTDRIRKMVVESGSKNLGQWLNYERDIRADFEKAFGEPPGNLVGIAIMTDSDNTRSTARAWYGRVNLANK